jgi:ketosteroid isomerase-like protein
MSAYAPDVLVFDLAPPLQHLGADLHRSNFAEWFATFRGPIGSEIRDLRITAGDEVAFCHCFNRINGTRTSGDNTDVWVRVTICCCKIDGSWKVTHEHVSVPFYMDGSFKAAVDLAP